MKQINISGIIGVDSTPEQLRQGLADAKGDDVEIVISSPGGYVGAGLEMFNLIRNHAGKTVARLSGYAMSMASYLPLAADTVIAEDNAILMIHNVQGGVFGDHNEILKYGEMTASMSRMLARAYSRHTGKPLEEIQAMMDAETYFFGQDMVDSGFVSGIIETEGDEDQQTACITAKIAWESCSAKMSADPVAVKNDINRAAALAGPEGSPIHNRVPNNNGPGKKGVHMDLVTLKAEHPDLVAAIIAEAQAGQQEAVSAAMAEGAASERGRIASVREQLIPGHEALIETMAFDGQSTGADAAMAIVGAEKSLRQSAASRITDEAPPLVPSVDSSASQTRTIKRADFNALGHGEQRAFVAAGGKLVD